MSGRVAIVTGAARGIGRSTVLRLAGEIDRFALFDLSGGRLEELRRELEAQGMQVLAFAQDLTDTDLLRTNIREVHARFGRLDVLVNCAGIFQTKDFLEITREDWERMLSVNLSSVFYAIQAVAPYMMRQKSGNIINIASVAGRQGRNGSPHYAATKAAVINLTQSAALTFAPYGIRVNCLCPGIIWTDMWVQIDEEETRKRGTERGNYVRSRLPEIPLGRAGSADEVAQVIRFLVSDEASYVTGQAINVCGGMRLN